MVILSKYTRGLCQYCDRPSITLDPESKLCAGCRYAMRVGGGPTDAERMRELLERLVRATQAGLRADDLEVMLIAQDAAEMLGDV